MPQRPRIPLQQQVDYLVRAVLGTNNKWEVKVEKKEQMKGKEWIGTAVLSFEKVGGKRNDPDLVAKQWARILHKLNKAGNSSNFNKYPWVLVDGEGKEQILPQEEESVEEVQTEAVAGVHDIVNLNNVLTIDDLKLRFPHDLMNGTDEYIENHNAFKGIYGRGAQIRSVLSSIWSFIVSGGQRTNHTLLFGKPACAKTQILLRILELFGDGAVLRLDATSTTRAGLEKLIFKQLKRIPPLFFMEEIEKADEQALRIWLGGMDDRHEFRKVNNNMCQVRKVDFLALATANDKEKFDGMMGGRPNSPGALSSRYVHQLLCPRPDKVQMRMILKRDIMRFGGKINWVEPCMALAEAMNTDDPRKVLGFLDGGDRLLDDSYQKDQLLIAGKQ